jgi:hypothetical protein
MLKTEEVGASPHHGEAIAAVGFGSDRTAAFQAPAGPEYDKLNDGASERSHRQRIVDAARDDTT